MRLIPALIVGFSVLMAALVGLLIFLILPSGDTPVVTDGGETDFTGGVVDSQARIDIEYLRGDVENLRADIDNLQQQIAQLEGQIALLNQDDQLGSTAGIEEGFETSDLADQYAQVVLVADRREINQGLVVASPSYLIEKLGMPREDLNDNCQPMTNPRLSDRLVKGEVGPIQAQMLKPAFESLGRVFQKIQETDPHLYARINTAGSLCVRRIRGSVNSVSTHSFGLAVDLNINGKLDTLGDGKTQAGLTIMADFFNAEGWVWGAAFGREDSMHFEISRKQLDEWIAAGEL
jgi:hypothetical protein